MVQSIIIIPSSLLPLIFLFGGGLTLVLTEAFTIQQQMMTNGNIGNIIIPGLATNNVNSGWKHQSLKRPHRSDHIRRPSLLCSSSSIDEDSKDTTSFNIAMDIDTGSTGSTGPTRTTRSIDVMDMPWSTMQEFALQDKIPNYLINIPQKLNNPTLQGGGMNNTTFCLWHSLRKDVTELMGYEISFLQNKYLNLQDFDADGKNGEDAIHKFSPGVLPYIDEFEFRKNGGIKGRVYGLIGIEPGTQIVTSPLKDVEKTLPNGFVLTDDGSCAYELGIPKSEILNGKKNKLAEYYNNMDSLNGYEDAGKESALYSMDIGAMKESGSKVVSNVSQQGAKVAGNVVNELSDPETSQMMVNLGTTTAIALGAATAMNMLSHHLTVNVFWV